MRLTVFIEGGDAVRAPEVELPHVTAVMAAFDTYYGGDKWGMTSEVGLHHFTPAHARQLIEMLTPIAAVVEHKLKVEAEGRHVRFKCSCNLLGLLRDTQGEALEDYKAHVLETAQAPAIAAQEVPDA